MQKTVLSPYFESSQKAIVRINKQSAPIFYSEFEKKIDVYLQKLRSNALTKTVRKILPKVYLGFNANSIHVPVYGIYVGDGVNFAGIIVDIVKCSASSNQKDIIEFIQKYQKINSEISQLSKKIDDRTLERISDLKKDLEKTQIMLANLIDYDRIIEGIYYTFMRFLVAEIDKGHSGKLFDISIDLFREIIKKAFSGGLDIHDEKLFKAATDYIFTISFSNMSSNQALTNINKRYGAEITDILSKANVKSLKKVSDIAMLFDTLKFMRITPIAFNTIISKKFGQDFLAILFSTYDFYVAWAVLTVYKSILFNMGPVDKDIQSEMEIILLNYKSKVRI